MKSATRERDVVRLILEHGLTREMVPTTFLNSVTVWDALLQNMPLMAMIRNLGKMTSVGLIKPFSVASQVVQARLLDIGRTRVHPLSVLVAMRTYVGGRGIRGSLQWRPDSSVVDALDEAFHLSFGNVVPTGKRICLALDVSGSMTRSVSGMPISCREASAAMAMVTARVEQQHFFISFQDRVLPLAISPRQRLDDVIRQISHLPFGRTDCAQPMLYSLGNGIEADAFIVLTDNETWHGKIHPFQALKKYRELTGIPAKLAVVAMTPTRFSIADPDDAGMMDVVGFDTATPNVISDFVGG
jgi:60 kDa SS-A/Ro ribonucleoprotein